MSLPPFPTRMLDAITGKLFVPVTSMARRYEAVTTHPTMEGDEFVILIPTEQFSTEMPSKPFSEEIPPSKK